MLHKYILLMLKWVACFAWINKLFGLFLFQRIPIFCFIFINKKYTLLLSTSLALKMSNVLKLKKMSKQFNNIQTQRYQLTTNMYSIIASLVNFVQKHIGWSTFFVFEDSAEGKWISWLIYLQNPLILHFFAVINSSFSHQAPFWWLNVDRCYYRSVALITIPLKSIRQSHYYNSNIKQDFILSYSEIFTIFRHFFSSIWPILFDIVICHIGVC